MLNRIVLSLIFALALAIGGSAQTTAFTYQGSLKDGANPANGNYDFEFALFDTVSGGAQIGSTLLRNNVPVANGIFSVSLDFGSQFPGATRFLEIRVRLAGQPGITTLGPRQLVNSQPYSLRSLTSTSADAATTATNATQLGGVAANQYVLTGDPRMSDARNPLPNNGNYVQNTINQQSADFNIDGNGTLGGALTASSVSAGTVSATGALSGSQLNIGGSRVLYAATLPQLLAVGIGAGTNTTGGDNTFVGNGAGQLTTAGGANSFFGRLAGNSNTASSNSFFGTESGFGNTSGTRNAYFGYNSGRNTQTGNDNTFMGYRSGYFNTATGNSFFGSGSGDSNTTGSQNSFFGTGSGQSISTSSGNTLMGYQAGYNLTTSNNTFVGSETGRDTTNGSGNSFFGWHAGIGNSSGTGNSFFGINAGSGTFTGDSNVFVGSDSGVSNFDGNDNVYIGSFAGNQIISGGFNVIIGSNAANFQNSGDNNVIIGAVAGQNSNAGSFNTMIGFGSKLGIDTGLTYATAIGAQAIVSTSNTIALGRTNGSDKVVIYGLGTAGLTTLCRNPSNQISTCSSSLRYKTNIGQFSDGLSFVNKLRPISFDWKDGGMKDVGFGAEDVAKIDPRFVTYNDKGEVEGVKYDRMSVAFVNAFKEQQTQIEEQDRRIGEQQNEIAERKATEQRLQSQIDNLKKIVCSLRPDADGCKQEEK